MATALSELKVLAIDCQATGANPDKGQLLEIGWTQTSASENGDTPSQKIETCLLNPPQGIEIPRHVRRITGISEIDLVSASGSTEVWKKLAETAHEIAAADHMEFCPTVIHFSRFEEPYLRQLHMQNDPESAFPFEIICTHEIAKRLLPGLPRRGIRAIAGYFGHSVDELRRSAHHIAATAFIWRKLVDMVGEAHGIRTLDELREWLVNTNASSRSGRAYPMNPRIRLGLPDNPGIYRMLRSNGDVLYVGKAKSLKRRVNGYFQKRGEHSEHILEMLTQAVDVDATITGSALEAAVLESDEIKRLSPPYNVALRKRNRKLRFCSRDMKHFSCHTDDLHIIGPLPSVESVKTFPAAGELLDGDISHEAFDKSVCTAVLGISRENSPEIDCFRAGFDIFRQRHCDTLNGNSGIRSLIKLGAHLWQERLAEHDPAESDPDNSDQDSVQEEKQRDYATDPGDWTPESVADSIESSIVRGAHLIRRARWFCLLCESSLAWKARETEKQIKHLIVFEKGAASRRNDIESDNDIPTPPGYVRKFRARRKNFDVTTYDRMRVVTTELRRLLSEEREIELRLSPSSILRNEQLERLLRCV